MNKKKIFVLGIILLVVIELLIVFLVFNKSTSLLKLDEYQEIKEEDIKSINIIKETKGEVENILQTDNKDIKKTIQTLKKYKVGKEVNKTCYDKRTIYLIELKSKKDISIEIECDWLVINGKRYILKK